MNINRPFLTSAASHDILHTDSHSLFGVTVVLLGQAPVEYSTIFFCNQRQHFKYICILTFVA